MTLYKHLAFMKFVSFNRHRWCSCMVGDWLTIISLTKKLKIKINNIFFIKINYSKLKEVIN